MRIARKKQSGFENRVKKEIICYACQKRGHIAKYSQVNGNKDPDRYCFFLVNPMTKRIRMFDKSGMDEIKNSVGKYPNAFGSLERPIEFTDIEKCSIKTPEGKKNVKRGVLIPQA